MNAWVTPRSSIDGPGAGGFGDVASAFAASSTIVGMGGGGVGARRPRARATILRYHMGDHSEEPIAARTPKVRIPTW